MTLVASTVTGSQPTESARLVAVPGQGESPARSPVAGALVSVATEATERGRRGTQRWRLARPALHGEIEGYPARSSAPAGARVPLKVSTGARSFHVEAYRVGAYLGGSARLVWRSSPRRGRRQAEPAFSDYARRTVAARWRTSLRLPTASWPEGVYLLKLVALNGWQAHVPYVVRSTSTRGRVVLVAPITTWQAYNDWGGYSLYSGPSGDRRAWAVSFNRPYPAPGARQLMFGVRSVVLRAERLGIPLAYLTNVDVGTVPRILFGARGYVSMGHDEYWTPRMRIVLLRARSRGTNLAFLGANTMYWRIRLEAAGRRANRVVVGYRSDAHLDPMRNVRPRLTTARFRDRPFARPENSLIGMRYECFPVDAPYVVTTPRWWGYAGTRTRRGEAFPHLVGVEADRVYPVPATPRPMQVVAHVQYTCGGVRTSGQAVYYTTSSGAGVFTAGTLRWTCALSGRCAPYRMSRRTTFFTRTVTDNLLRELARGPLGHRRPARDNVDRFDLPTRNNVAAS